MNNFQIIQEEIIELQKNVICAYRLVYKKLDVDNNVDNNDDSNPINIFKKYLKAVKKYINDNKINIEQNDINNIAYQYIIDKRINMKNNNPIHQSYMKLRCKILSSIIELQNFLGIIQDDDLGIGPFIQNEINTFPKHLCKPQFMINPKKKTLLIYIEL